MSLRLLLADDDESIRFILRNRFESCGVVVDEAATGEEAIARIAGGDYSLVLLDLNFPDMTGHEVLARLDPKRAPAVIVLSGSREPAWPCGEPPVPVIGCVEKPFDIHALTERVLAFMHPAPEEQTGGRRRPAVVAKAIADIRKPVEAEEARVRRYGGEFSLLLLDNATVDDQTMKAILGTLMRKVDRLYRDENGVWMVLLPETGVAGARQLAGRVRSHVLSRLGLKSRAGLRTGVGVFAPGDTANGVLDRARQDLSRFSETRVGMNSSLPVIAKEILFVEDDESLTFLVGMRLRMDGYFVRVAGTKKEALAELSLKIPDLLLMDVSLPDGTGLEVLRLVRQLPETKNVPVIMLTAMATTEDFEKGREAGADAYIAKPFDNTELFTMIDKKIRSGHLPN